MRKKIMIITAILILFALLSPTAKAQSQDNSLIIVNHQYMLSRYYTPPQLVNLNSYIKTKRANVRLRVDAAKALGQMAKSMAAVGISDIRATNGYRDYNWQSDLYHSKISYFRSLGYDYDKAVQLASAIVAQPGMSEHQTGLAVDLSTASLNNALDDPFADTAAGQWIAANCYKYGFIIRYPEDKIAITGYVYEPWHIRYVGQPHAEYISKNNLCLEEYQQLLAKQKFLLYLAENGTLYAIYHSSGGFYQFAGQVVSKSQIGDGYSIITTVLTKSPHNYLAPFSLQGFLKRTKYDEPVQNSLYLPALIAANHWYGQIPDDSIMLPLLNRAVKSHKE